jgi:transmembrane sensor
MEKKDLLDKWLNGELTPEEFEVFRTIPEFSSYLKIDAFAQEIDLPNIDVEAGLREIQQRKVEVSSENKAKVIRWPSVLNIAAVLMLLLASSWYVTMYKQGTVTAHAQTEIYTLPDNSRVTLNEDSKLSIKRFNWGNNRSVSFEGQAFFEVEEGSTFTVETDHGTVTVIGTKFNVIAIDFGFEISCYEGLVRVDQGDASFELPAGRRLFISGGEIQLSDVHTTEPGWIYNESRFDDQPVLKVLDVLESEYKLDLTTENIDVNLRFTGGFPNNDLEAALQAITVPLKLNYAIDGKDAVTIFGKIDSD